jgi:hypothetical protein
MRRVGSLTGDRHARRCAGLRTVGAATFSGCSGSQAPLSAASTAARARLPTWHSRDRSVDLALIRGAVGDRVIGGEPGGGMHGRRRLNGWRRLDGRASVWGR